MRILLSTLIVVLFTSVLYAEIDISNNDNSILNNQALSLNPSGPMNNFFNANQPDESLSIISISNGTGISSSIMESRAINSLKLESSRKDNTYSRYILPVVITIAAAGLTYALFSVRSN